MARISLLFLVLAPSLARVWAASPAPSITTQVPAVANQGSSVFILLPLVNSGNAKATSVQITSITLGTVKPTAPSSLPLAMGTMPAGALSFANLAFNDTSLITGNVYTLTVQGSYVFNAITSTFSVSRLIKFGVPSVFELPASPMNVVPTPDRSHAVTKMISARLGGTVTATAAGGAVFTLTLPANALLSDAQVTLTPLINVSGLPISNGFVAGVQVTPDELELMQPAKLTIQPPITVAINQQVGFSFHGSGQEFFFYPLDLVSSVSFSIHQFNSYGLGFGNITKTPIPTDMFDRLENELEPINASQRTALPLSEAASRATESLAQAGSANTSLYTQVVDALQSNWEQVTQPQLQAAEGPGGNMESDDQAAVNALKWARQVQLLGLDSEPLFAGEVANVWTAITVISKKEFAEAFQLCSSQPGPESVARLIGIVGTVARLNEDPATVLGSDYQAKIDKCANVTLTFDFDSEVRGSFSGGFPVGIATTDSLVQASGLKLKWNNGAFEIQSATLNYLNMSYTDASISEVTFCTKVVSTPPGNMTVRATPSVNRFGKTPFGKQPPFSMIVQIPSLHTFEQVLVAVIDSDGKCETQVTLVYPFYASEFYIVGGRNEFVMPLNSVKSFTRSGVFSASVVTWTAHEVNTTVTLNGP